MVRQSGRLHEGKNYYLSGRINRESGIKKESQENGAFIILSDSKIVEKCK
jgi:hypothetical protein